MIGFRTKGDFSKTTNYLKRLKARRIREIAERYAERGVQALIAATPKDTGLTAQSWYYKVAQNDKTLSISFCNSNIQNGVPIAIILQYGHATGNGGWVEGRDYINPAIQPIFDEITKNAWGEVTRI